jgi:hypothetical protein
MGKRQGSLAVVKLLVFEHSWQKRILMARNEFVHRSPGDINLCHVLPIVG